MKLVTHKSKNLLYRISSDSNTTVQFSTSYSVVTQTTADTASSLSFKLQGYNIKTQSYTYIFSGEVISSTGVFTKTFTTPSTTGFDLIRFGLNGAKYDTCANCKMDLKPSTTYTFTCNFTNITQGSISWKDMMLVEGDIAGEYEPYSYNLLDKWQYAATQTINGVTFTNNGDGTITYNGVTSVGANYSLQSGLKVVAGHKYLSYVGENTNDKISVLLYANEDPYDTFDNRFPNADGGISTALKNSNELYYQPKPRSNVSFSGFILKPQLYDLTLMYGAEKEPTTVDQFYADHPMLKIAPLGFIDIPGLKLKDKGIKRLRYKTADGVLDLGIIPSNSGYILNKYDNLSYELLKENVEINNVSYHIPDKTNILLNKVEGKTNKIVQLLDKVLVNCSSVNDWTGGTGSDTNLRVANGVVSIDGTLGSYSGVRTQDNKPIIKGHKYYISTWAMCSKNASDVLLPYTYGFSSSRSTLTANEWKNAEIIDTADVSDTTSIGVRCGSGESSEETVVWSAKKPQFFDLTAMYGFGNEPTTVEQFKKDYPQFFDEKLDGIWNVGTSGISTTGKNLFDISKWISSPYDVGNGTLVERLSNGAICQGNNGIGDGDSSYSNGWFRPMNGSPYSNLVHLKAGTYTVSADYTMIENSIVSTTRVGCYLYGDHQYTTSHTSVTVGNIVKVKSTYTVEEGYYYPVFTLNSGKVKIENIQIELNSTATTYEPYTENKIDLLSTQTLNGINGVNDYIEVIDKGNGLYDLKKTQNIDSVDLGTLDWSADGANFSSGSISSVIKPPTDGNSVGNYVCQKYVNVALDKSFVDGDFGVNSSGYLYFRNSAYTTAAAFKTAMNGVILYYQLKTPVTTTIATNLTYNQVSAIRTNGGLLLVNDNNNQKYTQPNVTVKGNYQYKS